MNTAIKSPQNAHEYISVLPGVLESSRVKVTIDNQVYEDCCRYRREFESPAGAQKPGKYVREMVYIVGVLPKCEDRKVCYTVAGDTREWFLIGGAYGIRKADRRKPLPVTEFNPFGNFFMVGPWDDTDAMEAYKGQKIDHHEPHPYKRVPMKIEN